jgi:hypothetical protein
MELFTPKARNRAGNQTGGHKIFLDLSCTTLRRQSKRPWRALRRSTWTCAICTPRARRR